MPPLCLLDSINIELKYRHTPSIKGLRDTMTDKASPAHSKSDPIPPNELLIVLEKLVSGRDSTFDKLYKLGQIVFPFILIWLVYYVNAELTPVRMGISNNHVLIKESQAQVTELRTKIHGYDIKDARRDAIMEQMLKELSEVKDLLKEFKR